MGGIYQEADAVSIDSSRGVRAPLQEKPTRAKVHTHTHTHMHLQIPPRPRIFFSAKKNAK